MQVIPPVPDVHAALTTFAVTGTNGKTSTTRFLRALLSRPDVPAVEVSTLGYFVGEEQAPLVSSFRGFVHHLEYGASRGATFAAIEYTSEALARRFAEAWPPHAAIFTNLTRDHLDAHPSWEHYLASKAQLFTNLPAHGAAILNADSPLASFIAEVCASDRIYRSSVLAAPDAEIQARVHDRGLHGSRVEIVAWPDELAEFLAERSFDLPLPGRAFASNALQAVACVAAGGVRVDRARLDPLADCRIPGRFEVLSESPTVVVDFAHSPDAVERMIETARPHTPGDLVVLLGAGGQRDKGKRPEMGAACAAADRVVIASDNARTERADAIADAIASGIPATLAFEVVLDRAEAIERAVAELRAEDTLLILGRGAETTLTVKDQEVAFDDREVARQALQSRGTA